MSWVNTLNGELNQKYKFKIIVMKKIHFIIALIVMTMVSCVMETEKATVETIEVTDVTSSSARVICNVSDDGGTEVSSRGVCWDTIENPTVEMASSVEAGSGIGNYDCDINGLESNTTYYVRAYATNSVGISYGEERSFNTLNGNDDNDDNEEIAGHGYVDLGLPSGLKWATCNVGSENPEDYGYYFAWGETSPKTVYDWETYQHWIDNNEDGEFDDGSDESTINSDISGDALYDAATANWGESWRMPTKDEMYELVKYCEWELICVNGVYGSKVIGPNGNCIFLPVAGSYDGPSVYYDGGYGYYWTSTPNEYNDCIAYDLNIFGNGNENVSLGLGYTRAYGHTVRPVSE